MQNPVTKSALSCII